MNANASTMLREVFTFAWRLRPLAQRRVGLGLKQLLLQGRGRQREGEAAGAEE